MSANRIHQSTPTQIMLDAADEVGFALQPETAIRGECPVRPLSISPLISASDLSFRHCVAAALKPRRDRR